MMVWPADIVGGPGSVVVQSLRRVTASGPITVADATLIVDTSGGALVLTLPSPASCPGQRFTLKKVSNDGNSFTLSGATIEGSVSIQVMAQYEAVAIVSDGAVYYVLYRG